MSHSPIALTTPTPATIVALHEQLSEASLERMAESVDPEALRAQSLATRNQVVESLAWLETEIARLAAIPLLAEENSHTILETARLNLATVKEKVDFLVAVGQAD